MTSEPPANLRAHLLTGTPDGRSAIAAIQIDADPTVASHYDADIAITRLLRTLRERASPDARPGVIDDAPELAVRSVLHDERAVIVRPTPGTALIMLHAGPAVIDAFMHALVSLGVHIAPHADDPAPPDTSAITPVLHAEAVVALARRLYPEAETPMESAMLLALSRAHSPLAIEALLAQPERWRTLGVLDPCDAERTRATNPTHDTELNNDRDRERSLARLIRPALVAAIGSANIGKSTLLNTLAGRGVALAYDMPGTTRDHVGATIDLAGLVVRWLDTPGFDTLAASAHAPDPLLALARQRALVEAAAADLLVLCAGPARAFVLPPNLPAPGQHVLRVGLRADQGPPASPHDVLVAAGTSPPSGIADLVGHVRERLVPGRWLSENRPWRFWRALDATYP
jgi:hypothetical protein